MNRQEKTATLKNMVISIKNMTIEDKEDYIFYHANSDEKYKQRINRTEQRLEKQNNPKKNKLNRTIGRGFMFQKNTGIAVGF